MRAHGHSNYKETVYTKTFLIFTRINDQICLLENDCLKKLISVFTVQFQFLRHASLRGYVHTLHTYIHTCAYICEMFADSPTVCPESC
jgi:hypothetical protein